MKKLSIVILLLIAFNSYAQETETPVDSVAMAKQKTKEIKEVQKDVEKEEKKVKKAEKEVKKAEKERRKKEKLAKAIKGKEKSISKNKAKVVKLEEKLLREEAKGKLSPVAKAKLNTKIQKHKATIVRDKERLRKLVKKQ